MTTVPKQHSPRQLAPKQLSRPNPRPLCAGGIRGGVRAIFYPDDARAKALAHQAKEMGIALPTAEVANG